MTTMTTTTDSNSPITTASEDVSRLQSILSTFDLRLAQMGERTMDSYATRKALAGTAAV